MRIGQERLRGVAAMAGMANDTTDTPRRRLRRARGAKRSAATRVSPCAVRKPGQDGWRDRQTQGASTSSAKPFARVASTSWVLADDPREAHHHWRLIQPELLGGGLQEGHKDRDQQDVVPQGWLQRTVRRTWLGSQHRLQWRPERVGASLD